MTATATAKLDRRQFLITALAVGGGLGIALSLPGGAHAQGERSGELSPWLTIGPDDKVTVLVPTPETGNGVMTQCAMFVAEELGCRWSDIHAEMVSPNADYLRNRVYSTPMDRLGFFAGRSTGKERMDALLQAGASARERLRLAAAQTWKAPLAEVTARDGLLVHAASKRQMRYGEAAAAAAEVHLAEEPTLKPPSEWTLIGRSLPTRLGDGGIVNGSAIYGIDVRLPNMLYAAIRQSPVHGGKLKSYDFETIRSMPGVHSVVVVDPAEPRFKGQVKAPFGLEPAVSGLAVIADHYWQAKTALDKLDPTIVWDDGETAQWKTTEQLNAAALAACDVPGKVLGAQGDAHGKLAEPGGKVVRASYLTPFCDHVTMEPLNGTALVTANRVDVWHPTSHMAQAYAVACEETGLPPEKVHVHATLVGGSFGRRVNGNDVRMVVAIAKKVPGRPVHVIWSREESMRQGRYRALNVGKYEAKLGPDGLPAAMRVRISGVGSSSLGLGGPAYFRGPIKDFVAEQNTMKDYVLTGPYRGPAYNSNLFMLESFIDECATAAGVDPLEYRLRLLAAYPDPAWSKLLKVLAEKSEWARPLPRGQGRGVAIGNWNSLESGKPLDGTTVATVARVEVSRKGELKVHQLDVAFDCGKMANKDGVLQQLQGGTIFGLNMALNEGLTIKNGMIVETNYGQYPMLKLADIPDIRIHFEGLSGADRYAELGEPPAGPVGPAIANAIFAATGKRIRETPFRKQDITWT